MVSQGRKPSSNTATIEAGQKTTSEQSSGVEDSRPKRWWQWVLIYPTLLISLIGSIPTAVELVRSTKTGVPFGQSSAAIQQKELWEKNMRCTSAPFDVLVNENNVQVDATICKSGDVLVRFISPDNRGAYRWVPVERFETRTAGFSVISSAFAQGSYGRQNETVQCQWSREPGLVVRKIQISSNNKLGVDDRENKECFEEIIRSYTGEVVEKRRVPCDQPCGGSR